MKNSKHNLPWWLETGTEACPACGHEYVLQTAYRCAACDGEVCAECVQVVIELEVFCPDCVPAAATKPR